MCNFDKLCLVFCKNLQNFDITNLKKHFDSNNRIIISTYYLIDIIIIIIKFFFYFYHCQLQV
jgi:hypothetical protein